MPAGCARSSGRVAERPRRGVLRSAGRGALTVLRQTSLRAKLGSLHLPLDLRPGRQRTILLPQSVGTPEGASGPDADLLERTAIGTGAALDESSLPAASESELPPAVADAMRALRRRLGASERRVARLRQALEWERQARQQTGLAPIAAERLIEQLVADLHQADAGNPDLVRATVTRVLGAHGIALPCVAAPATAPGAAARRPEPGLLVVPGWEPARLAAVLAAVAARQPEIDGVRTLRLALDMLSGGQALSAAEAARAAGLTSAMARRRMRLALEGLCAAGMLRRQGERFAVCPPGCDDEACS